MRAAKAVRNQRNRRLILKKMNNQKEKRRFEIYEKPVFKMQKEWEKNTKTLIQAKSTAEMNKAFLFLLFYCEIRISISLL